ncbi:hypothetical protein JEQ12_012129 [Ovis aries]|uniref:Uncharacterized protein n=1 Tax=Ovis aries TaxID=9940 RepID=A0A835ZRU4_SHEEP|nr:hypothetical protein JEQ12_012129 [Ovis aries]
MQACSPRTRGPWSAQSMARLPPLRSQPACHRDRGDASGADAVLGRQAEERQGSIEERLRRMEAQLENKELPQDQLILNLETLRAELEQTRLRGAPFHHGQAAPPGSSPQRCRVGQGPVWRPHLGSAPDLRFPVADQPADSSGSGEVLQHPQKGWLAALCDEPSKARTPPPPSRPWWAPCEAPAPSHCAPEVQTLKEQDWERTQQASILADVAQAFESDEGMSDGEGDRVTLFSSATQLLPSGQADAKTLSVRLQGQLDAINEEIRVCKIAEMGGGYRTPKHPGGLEVLKLTARPSEAEPGSSGACAPATPLGQRPQTSGSLVEDQPADSSGNGAVHAAPPEKAGWQRM